MNQGRRKTPPVQPLDNQQEDQPIPPPRKCPRCNSMNTKFCYYNNYNLSQPRYHCKTCRRYWTHGGTQREIPVGGSCRKPKRLKTSSSNIGESSRLQQLQPSGRALNYSDGGFTSMNYFPQPLSTFRVGSSSPISYLPEFNQHAQNLQSMDFYQMSNEGMIVEQNRLLGYVNNNNDDYRSNPYTPLIENSLNYLPDSYPLSFENSLNYLPDSYPTSFESSLNYFPDFYPTSFESSLNYFPDSNQTNENSLNYLPDSYPTSFENSLNYFPDSYLPSFENSLNYLPDSYPTSFENSMNYLPDSYPTSFENSLDYFPDSYLPSFENSLNYLPDFPGYDPPPL